MALDRWDESVQRLLNDLQRQQETAAAKVAKFEREHAGKTEAYQRGVSYGFSVAANAVKATLADLRKERQP